MRLARNRNFAFGMLAALVGIAGLLVVSGSTPWIDARRPARALPKAEHAEMKRAVIVDITADGVLIAGRRVADTPRSEQGGPTQALVYAMRALKGSMNAAVGAPLRVALRAEMSTDAAIVMNVLEALHEAGHAEVVPSVEAGGRCLTAPSGPPAATCQLAIAPIDLHSEQTIWTWLVLRASGFAVVNSAGARIEHPMLGGKLDTAGLRSELRELKKFFGSRRDLDIAAESGVSYGEIVTAMDLAIDEGIDDLFLLHSSCAPRWDCVE